MKRKEIERRLDKFQEEKNYCFREYEEEWIIDFVEEILKNIKVVKSEVKDGKEKVGMSELGVSTADKIKRELHKDYDASPKLNTQEKKE